MSSSPDTYLTGANIDFIEAQYARFLDDPTAVEPSWHALFAGVQRDGRPLITDGLVLKPPSGGNGHAASRATAWQGMDPGSMGLQSKVDQTIFSFRLRGHLVAQLDPLGVPRPPLDHVADISLFNRAHYNEAELNSEVDPQGTFDAPRVTVRSVLERLRATYSHHIGVEYVHMYNSERRRWLMRRMEHTDNTTHYSHDERLRIALKMAEAETFEHTIHTKFQAAKRFSVEGGEALLPMLDAFLELGGSLGIREVVIGMAHRGRLNVLCNIMGKPAHDIFSEFGGPKDPKEFVGRGDVKYHMGYSCDWHTAAGQSVHVTMAFNPSHLGVVHPVVVGRVRAKQDRMGGGDAAKHAIVPLVIHGDTAFAGQGLVAETLNLSGVPAYDTGGTVHLVINNQVGYTTEAEQSRTPIYCTSQAQLLDIPVFHVNGDDPEACVHVMRLATEYRQRYQTDVVIDLVCYRKYGHNEGDEPRFTQPAMYGRIGQHPSPWALYGKQLVDREHLTAQEVSSIHEGCIQRFSDAHASARAEPTVKDPSHGAGLWSRYTGGLDVDTPQTDTAISPQRAAALMKKLGTMPEGFTLHANVVRGVIEKRHRMSLGEENLDWGAGEMLAYASLLTDGYRLRVSGQDTERGTFAHRHAVLHDVNSERMVSMLAGLSDDQATGLVVNSPLSEMACMGFEYGYSLDAPDMLVAWEAQFGDFANNAQVMIDQFIATSEDKWKRLTGLVLLLPHGYEGAGPEHSSARLERFLDIAAEDNIQVCYPTNSAQMFHLLRRQVVRPIRKPLVVMTPKSLMRLPEASSPLAHVTTGGFQRTIPEDHPRVKPKSVTRLLLCSGKVYFDLRKARDEAADFSIAIERVEQLYPLPTPELEASLKRYSGLKEVFWVQEEPKNSGAWRYLLEPMMTLLDARTRRPSLKYVGRPESSSPATGYLTSHRYEQQLLVSEAISRGT